MTDELGDSGDDGVSAGSKSSHEIGKPISSIEKRGLPIQVPSRPAIKIARCSQCNCRLAFPETLAFALRCEMR